VPERPRRDEIIAWLKAHPDIERYAVIDDEDDELDDLPLFQLSARAGLSDEIVNGVVAYLTGRTDKDMRRSRLKRVLPERLHRHQRARRIAVVGRRRRPRETVRTAGAVLLTAPEAGWPLQNPASRSGHRNWKVGCYRNIGGHLDRPGLVRLLSPPPSVLAWRPRTAVRKLSCCLVMLP
jgi:hypothetical protein